MHVTRNDRHFFFIGHKDSLSELNVDIYLWTETHWFFFILSPQGKTLKRMKDLTVKWIYKT